MTVKMAIVLTRTLCSGKENGMGAIRCNTKILGFFFSSKSYIKAEWMLDKKIMTGRVLEENNKNRNLENQWQKKTYWLIQSAF